MSFLEGIVVRGLNGEPTMLSELWRDQTVILKVMRRFGCPLCRYESRLLSNLKPYFDDLNVRLVGIGFEEVGLQEFMAGRYWEWELFLDTSRTLHAALGLGMLGLLQGLRDVVSYATRMTAWAAHRLGLGGNLSGDGFQLGGTFVISPTRGLVYEHRQTGVSTFPSVKQIVAVVGGDPDLVVEVTAEEYVEPSIQSEYEDNFELSSDDSDFQFNE